MTTLSSEEAPGEVDDTRLKQGVKWNEWDWCRDTAAMNQYLLRASEEEVSALNTKGLESSKVVSGKPPISKKSQKKKQLSRQYDHNPQPTPLKGGCSNDFQTPAIRKAGTPTGRFSKHISPADIADKNSSANEEFDDVRKRPGNSGIFKKKRSLLDTPGGVSSEQDSSATQSTASNTVKRRRPPDASFHISTSSPLTSINATMSSNNEIKYGIS